MTEKLIPAHALDPTEYDWNLRAINNNLRTSVRLAAYVAMSATVHRLPDELKRNDTREVLYNRPAL
jgi:hypothetical protein